MASPWPTEIRGRGVARVVGDATSDPVYRESNG